jgi:pyrroline-5-carboxylate reductase
MSVKLVVVGGGKMGGALVGGLISSGWASADELAVVGTGTATVWPVPCWP